MRAIHLMKNIATAHKRFTGQHRLILVFPKVVRQLGLIGKLAEAKHSLHLFNRLALAP